jgi:uracil phosphoribosyltransferase/adenylate kinase/phosphoserine phosphatase
MSANDANLQSNRSQAVRSIQSTADDKKVLSASKATVIGLYGIPGSGKTFLLNQLKRELEQESFIFYEGSQEIATLVPGGLEAFQKLEESEKDKWRKLAIDKIGKESAARGQTAIVTGHFMFWSEDEEVGRSVCTQNDLETFTHLIYLDIDVSIISQRRLNDQERQRPLASIAHLHRWQEAEKSRLRDLCGGHNILFTLLSLHSKTPDKVVALVKDFGLHNEGYNLSQTESALDKAVMVGQRRSQLETVLVLDADRTLAAEDTGALFWEQISISQGLENKDCPLNRLFRGPLKYSYTAFRQAMLLYEEAANENEFETLCQEVAPRVTMYPEFVSLLQLVATQEHVSAVIITCGLQRVWEKVLERERLSKTVTIIGGGRISNGYVVTPVVKTALVSRLKDTHRVFVWAFGDSPLDIGMLSKADRAIVVVGDETTRSKSMDETLRIAVESGGLQAHQAVLSSTASPRLDIRTLPLIQLDAPEFIGSVLHQQARYVEIQPIHATDRQSAKLLMTPMRDARISGPILRAAHYQVGWYLATEFLADIIGTEEYPIPHVQGHDTTGHRLLHEDQTSVVALMRGGEPMALGVSSAFPLAQFVHAKDPKDLRLHHLHGQKTIVLVDSVVNSGKTIVRFAQHIRNLNASVRIVVIAGVVQAQAVSSLSQALVGHTDNFSLIALRLSDNKFTGKGTTDTGNRLFNTTHLL